MSEWFVYIIKCNDGSLYTGITKDLNTRMKKHNLGTGAAYTRSRKPVSLVYKETYATRSDALKREAQVKKLNREKKTELIISSKNGK